MNLNVHSNTTLAKTWKQLKWSLTEKWIKKWIYIYIYGYYIYVYGYGYTWYIYMYIYT